MPAEDEKVELRIMMPEWKRRQWKALAASLGWPSDHLFNVVLDIAMKAAKDVTDPARAKEAKLLSTCGPIFDLAAEAFRKEVGSPPDVGHVNADAAVSPAPVPFVGLKLVATRDHELVGGRMYCDVQVTARTTKHPASVGLVKPDALTGTAFHAANELARKLAAEVEMPEAGPGVEMESKSLDDGQAAVIRIRGELTGTSR